MAYLADELESTANLLFEQWRQTNLDSHTQLPVRGRLYGALVILDQLEKKRWSYSELSQAVSTDPGKFFGNRSIVGHTRQRIAQILESHGFADLAPRASQGELGRTSTGTKLAGLQFIRLIQTALSPVPSEDKEAQGEQLIAYLYSRIFALLLEHQQLGGIEITYTAVESITAHISKLLDAHQANPGAVLQHLIGAKLEIRYSDKSIHITHHTSATADLQTGRLGDFEIGSTVFHITKSPNDDHYRKAWQNAESGRKVYLLVPNKIVAGTSQFAEAYRSGFTKRVNVFSIEQFVAQNLDELAAFDRTEALRQFHRLLTKYNELVTQYEHDPSLKIVIPDLGIE